MISLWQRLPVVVRAVVAGVAVAAAGIVPWAMLATANQRVLLSVPWAVVPTALYLWLLWRYLNGEGWPSSSSAARRSSLRANAVPADAWGIALMAGMIGMAALLPLASLLGRLVALPVEAQPITPPADMPFITTFTLLVMGSIVAGVVEEAAFRGYMQGPIERRHGPVAALLISGVLFGAGHVNHHPSAVLAMMPFYVGVVAVYGGIAYFTNSIVPGIVLHALGDVWSLTRLWITGQPEWQLSAQPARTIWETGVDGAFWGSLTAFLVFGAAAVWAFVALADATRGSRLGGPQIVA